MSGGVFASWILAAFAPVLAVYWALRRGALWPLAAGTVVGALPIAAIAILAYTLPQN